MPVRTWAPVAAQENDEPTRWDMLLDGEPVEGAYIERVESGEYMLHFPRLVPSTMKSLENAQHALENAPLCRSRGIQIRRPAALSDDDELVSIDEAAHMLEVARPRINAMVANGVLAATRKDGAVLISKKSLLKRLGQESTNGPKGRFANRFVQYFPNIEEDAFVLLEVDMEDEEQLNEARAFVERVRADEESVAGARVVGYKTAMKLRSSQDLMSGDELNGIIPFSWFSEEDYLCQEPYLDEPVLC